MTPPKDLAPPLSRDPLKWSQATTDIWLIVEWDKQVGKGSRTQIRHAILPGPSPPYLLCPCSRYTDRCPLPLKGQPNRHVYAHICQTWRRNLSWLYHTKINGRRGPDHGVSSLHTHGIHGVHRLFLNVKRDGKEYGTGNHWKTTSYHSEHPRGPSRVHPPTRREQKCHQIRHGSISNIVPPLPAIAGIITCLHQGLHGRLH